MYLSLTSYTCCKLFCNTLYLFQFYWSNNVKESANSLLLPRYNTDYKNYFVIYLTCFKPEKTRCSNRSCYCFLPAAVEADDRLMTTCCIVFNTLLSVSYRQPVLISGDRVSHDLEERFLLLDVIEMWQVLKDINPSCVHHQFLISSK